MRLATNCGEVSCPPWACQAMSYLPGCPLTFIVQPDKRQLWGKKVPAPSRHTQHTNEFPQTAADWLGLTELDRPALALAPALPIFSRSAPTTHWRHRCVSQELSQL